MSEVPTDRFTVQGIDSKDMPITYEVDETENVDGLSTYRIRLGLNVDDSWSGQHEGDLVVTTSSRLRPRVKLPVKFEVVPRVRAVPSVVALGTVNVGEVIVQRVQLVSRHEQPLDVTIEGEPDGCSVEIDKQNNPTELVVAMKPPSAGIWRGTIKATVAEGSWKDLIEIPCVGFVQEAW
jgi:hypothetical protein